MSSVVRGTSLRAGGACVRCRKGKTKCVYDNGRAPCKNCAKGMHECYLPSESMSHHHGQSPARVSRPRDTGPADRSVSSANERPAAASQTVPRMVPVNANSEKLTPELIAECERVINKMLPACVAFHKPSFLQKLKSGTLENSIVNGLLTCAARNSPTLIRRFGGANGAAGASEHFAVKAMSTVMQNIDNPNLADIQTIALMTIHEWGNRNAIRAYTYLGMGARLAQMWRIVSAHQTENEPDRFIRDESFRRTLWLLYILDCFLTSSPGRLPAITQFDIKGVQLPCPDMSFNFGTPVFVRTLSGEPPSGLPDPATPLTEVGEFGHIVMATQAWRNVIEMLTTVTPETFSEEHCAQLDQGIEDVRAALPMHYIDKAGHINLHITMGSGYTYAMLHCLLHCASIMVNRRRLLHLVTTNDFNMETLRNVPHASLPIVNRVFAAGHNIVQLLVALEANADKENVANFPLVMLFSCFTACSTIAWFSLKGLTPTDANETAEQCVNDGMHFLREGAGIWILAVPWYRHLSVMAKVLQNNDSEASNATLDRSVVEHRPAPTMGSVQEETASQPDNGVSNPDHMDYERQPSANAPDQSAKEGSEPPRKSGFSAINGGSSTPATVSPPPQQQQHVKAESPRPASENGAQANSEQGHVQGQGGTGSDMTAAELCLAFERQLLELDDLAAFMGGGV